MKYFIHHTKYFKSNRLIKFPSIKYVHDDKGVAPEMALLRPRLDHSINETNRVLFTIQQVRVDSAEKTQVL